MAIKDQLELVKNWKLKPDFIINLKVNYSLTKSISDESCIYLDVLYTPIFCVDIPLSGMCAALQIPDQDLEIRRVGQRVDQVTGEIYTQDIYNPEKPPKQVIHYIDRCLYSSTECVSQMSVEQPGGPVWPRR